MSNELSSNNEPRYKSRIFMLELYDDTEEWTTTCSLVFAQDNVSYVYHDKDGCKSHYHAIIRFPNAVSNQSVANQFEMPVKFVGRQLRREKIVGAFQYLIHMNDEDKYQYSVDAVQHTSEYMRDTFLNAVNKTDENESCKVLRVLDLIDSFDDYCSYSIFIREVCKLDLYDVVRRSNYMFCKILDEHNIFYKRKEC